MHSKYLTIDGERWGRFSYRWLLPDNEPGAQASDLTQLFPLCGQFKIDPELPYREGNIRCQVQLIRDGIPLSMDQVYTEEDIVEHCTSEEQKFALWRAHTAPFEQPSGFFWSNPSEHEGLEETIDRLAAESRKAPTSGLLKF